MQETLAGLAKVQRYLAESEEHKDTWKGYAERVRAITDGFETLG
jgi:hypothetical protein